MNLDELAKMMSIMKRFMCVQKICLICLALCPAFASASQVPGHSRSWELVTPGDPIAASVYDAPLVNSDGTRIIYTTIGPIPGASGGSLLASNLAVRSESGWNSTPIGFPYSISTLSFNSLLTAIPVAFSSDFSTSIWVGLVPLTPDAPSEGNPALYSLSPTDGLTLLTQVSGINSFVGASDDAQHVIFTSKDHLLPADGSRASGESIYEINGTTLHLVDVNTDGTLLSECGSTVSTAGGVSRTGYRIFFTSPGPSSSCTQPSKVYLRENASTTVPVSESQCDRPDCNFSQPASFAGATPDGSTVFLITKQQLTNADVDESRDLYAFDVTTGVLRLISQSVTGETGEVTEGLVKPSDNGSSVNFFVSGRLLPGVGRESGENLYLADQGGVHFVAPIGEDDPLQISSSGQVAVFTTAVSLEDADTDSQKDVYVYNAISNAVTRVSAGPLGGNEAFDADISSPISPIGLGLDPEGRALSEDGKRVFFSTVEQLVPEDINEAMDLYEWVDGRRELVSSGAGNGDAEFAGASANGATAIFKTIQSLLPEDRDGGERDLYATRLEGGFPHQSEETKCTEESCLEGPSARISRDSLLSERYGPKQSHRGPQLRPLGPHVGGEIIEHGYMRVRIRVPGPGAVFALASTLVGGRSQTVLHGAAGAIRAGVITLRLHAAAWVRRRLKRNHILRLRISLRQSDMRFSDDVVVRWKETR